MNHVIGQLVARLCVCVCGGGGGGDCNVVLSVLSSFAVILVVKRKLLALL